MLQNHIKIYSGIEILVNRLQYLLAQEKISSIVNNSIEAGRLAGFGTLDQSIDLFIPKNDLEKASPILESFLKEISE